MRPFALSVLLFLLGLAFGAHFDAAPLRAPVQRGGYQVLAFDLHAHTRFSDGFLSPVDLVLHAKRRGLDGIAVTEHNLLFPGRIARAWSQRIGGPIVLLGEEVTTGPWHVVALGIHERVSSRGTLAEAIDAIHAQHGLAIAAHPVRHFWPALEPAVSELDGAEVMHPLAYAAPRRGADWSWDSMREFFLRARAKNPRFVAIGSSDYHGLSPLGLCRTYVFAERADEASVLAALHAGRTVVYDTAGRAYGDPDAIAALARDPYPPREELAGYAARSTLDAFTRFLGLLGAFGILLFRPRERAVELIPVSRPASSPASSA